MKENNKISMDKAELRNRLLDLILEKCFRLGTFTLASGRKSEYYIDGRIASLHPEGAYCIGKLFIDWCIEHGADAVGGLTLGADPIVGAIVALSHSSPRPLRGFIVRKKQKDHGTGKLVEGDIHEGDTVVIVEDVVTTGASAMDAANAATAAGARVKAVLAVVDREEGGAEVFAKEGLIFIPLFTASELKRAALQNKNKKR